jgi:hypothetical protein
LGGCPRDRFETSDVAGPCSWAPKESQVKSYEHQDNAYIHCQPFPESVSKEREIYTDYDSGHHHHVKHASYLSTHFSLDGASVPMHRGFISLSTRMAGPARGGLCPPAIQELVEMAFEKQTISLFEYVGLDSVSARACHFRSPVRAASIAGRKPSSIYSSPGSPPSRGHFRMWKSQLFDP